MHFPVYIRLFGFSIHPHLLFESLGYSIGFLVFRLLKRRLGDAVPQDVRWSVIAAAAFGAAAGSKLLYWLEAPQRIVTHWNSFAIVWGGKTIVGGLIGGLIAVEWTKKKLGYRDRTGDLFAVPLCVGTAIGRTGCFLTGLEDDTYGRATSLPWGVDFGDGIARHPTQLYEILFLVVLGGLLFLAMRRQHTQGDIFKGFMVSYGAWRLAIDFLKPDPRYFGMNFLQWACLGVLLYYARDIKRWISYKPQPRAALAAGES
jgi:phosphatidylglycerol---prolipoprotein diacylglyceryl transferase